MRARRTLISVTLGVVAAASTVAAVGPIAAPATVAEQAVRAGDPVTVGDPFVTPTRTLVISDSVFTAIRWNGYLDRLHGTEWVMELEPCRSLTIPSCPDVGPPTVLEQLGDLPFPPDRHDLLVIATGYNDFPFSFESDFASVVGAARAVGFRWIVWVNHHLGGSSRRLPDYVLMNRMLDELVRSGAYPDVSIWDYAAFTEGHRDWFLTDNVHLTATGALHTADWLTARITAS